MTTPAILEEMYEKSIHQSGLYFGRVIYLNQSEKTT